MNSGRDIYLIGAGGHGRVVLDALLRSGQRVAGILDPALPVGRSVQGVSVLGADSELDGIDVGGALLAIGVGATPGSRQRADLFSRNSARGFVFVQAIHPSVVLAADCALEEGCQVMAGAVLQTGSKIGVNAVINTKVSIDHDCHVSDHVFISPGAILCGGVTIGPHTFIGAGAVILPGIRIGSHAVVGAGAIVTRDVSESAMVAGTPAKDIRKSFS
jgi:sugar O-acyltransferase (sialic acid O-acetyltransferase NeuD family)